MLRALEDFEIGGPPTLLGFHRALLEHPCFVAGETCHGVVESDELAARAAELTRESVVSTQSPVGNGRLRERVRSVELGGRRYDVTLLEPEPPWAALARRRRERVRSGSGGAGTDAVVSPMQGTVLKVEVAEGDEVEAGQVLCVVEAMKMENEIASHRAGTVTQLSVTPGAAVASGQVVCLVQGE
jgi:acetyl-CoA/propionyl-CoA carboxylase biotin carboxyl carrier protein